MFVYVLKSDKESRLYIGMTENIEKRLKKHLAGGVPSTKTRRPLRLVYQESVETREDARRREVFLKSGPGHRFLAAVIEG